jgi:peptidyl-prolyl cis-trans isomerase SurA
MLPALVLLAFTAVDTGAVVVDRMAVVVGKHVIKLSDILRDLRLTDFLNREPLKLTPEQKRKAAERLIDQELIRQEMIAIGTRRASAADAKMLENQLVRDRFGGSDMRLKEALARYGLTESQLRDELEWQLSVLRFIDERFRSGVFVADEDVRAYYDQHVAELRRANPHDSSFEALAPKIREKLEAGRVDESFERWLAGARMRAHIQYYQEAFQ